jgi:hypothetical protein
MTTPIPAYTVDDLATVAGRDPSFYDNAAFVPQAILEATLLFQLATNRADLPDDDQSVLLARLGILSMADAIYLVQPFQEQIAQPFNSETIGSYSYSRLQSAALGGLPTGISWFDTSIKYLNVGRATDLVFGGIETLEHDATYGKGSLGGNKRLISARRQPRPARKPIEQLEPSGPLEGDGLEGWLPDPDDPGFLLYEEEDPA